MVRPEADQWVVMVAEPAADDAPLTSARAGARAVPARAAAGNGASMRADRLLPVASAICEATVRFQMRS